MKKYQRILLAVDQSDIAHAVIESAADLISDETEVLLATVVDYPGTLGAINEEALINEDIYRAEDWLRQLSDKHRNVFRIAKKFTQRVYVGTPARLVAHDIPVEEKIDLTIIGKTSRTSIMDKIFLGSTAKMITEDSICDVMVIKTKKRSM